MLRWQLLSMKELTKNSVKVLTNAEAVKFSGNEILLDSGEVIVSDLTILSVGIKPETSLTKTCWY